MKRLLIYVSHPLSGNPEGNRKSAREITARLSDRCGFRDFIFVNPLDMFQGQGMTDTQDRHILSQAIEVMLKCDGVIFCDGWKRSRGCRMEHFLARKAGMLRWLGAESFQEGLYQGIHEHSDSLQGFYNARAQSLGYRDLDDYFDSRITAGEGGDSHGEHQCAGAGCPAGKGTEAQGNPAGNA